MEVKYLLSSYERKTYVGLVKGSGISPGFINIKESLSGA